MVQTAAPQARVVGRYALHGEFAAGGMATVHFGLLHGAKDFARPVAIKRLHPHLAKDPAFVAMFIDEARLAARVRHPNVVPTLDVVEEDGEVLVVMEYVAGESLNRLLRTASRRAVAIPRPIVAAMFVGVLDGLHAAHEARDERGEPLMLVHRDVSPHNILVGVDGVARVLDFGIAKATGRLQRTEEGQIKGKLAYMAPEQLHQMATRGSDIYAAGVCLWETLTLHRLFDADNPSAVIAKVSAGLIEPPSRHTSDVSPELDSVVLRALDRDPSRRFATANEMARALEACVPLASASAVGAWVDSLLGPTLRERAARVANIERHGSLVRSDAQPATSAVSESPRRLLWAGLVAVAALLAASGAAIAFRSSRPPAPTPAAAVSATASLTEVATSPAASGEPPASAQATASTPSPAPSTAAPAAQPNPRHRARPPAPTPTTKTNDCDPPYTVDSDGVRQYKKWCLQ